MGVENAKKLKIALIVENEGVFELGFFVFFGSLFDLVHNVDAHSHPLN